MTEPQPTGEIIPTVDRQKGLKEPGVNVRFEREGIDTAKVSSELITAIYAAFAQKESESISGNMRWSYRQEIPYYEGRTWNKNMVSRILEDGKSLPTAENAGAKGTAARRSAQKVCQRQTF